MPRNDVPEILADVRARCSSLVLLASNSKLVRAELDAEVLRLGSELGGYLNELDALAATDDTADADAETRMRELLREVVTEVVQANSIARATELEKAFLPRIEQALAGVYNLMRDAVGDGIRRAMRDEREENVDTVPVAGPGSARIPVKHHRCPHGHDIDMASGKAPSCDACNTAHEYRG